MENKEFNLPESYGYHFNIIFVNIKRMMEIKLKPYNLTHLQFSILINIYKNNVTTQKEMLKYINGDEASITRLIDRLESKGYLNRVQSTEDKRKKSLVLTKSGITLSKEIIGCAREVNKELTKDLNEDEAKVLLKLLQKVHISISENEA
ncbi:MarR family winged helix-turn-helix transcriptional regulator [Sulfurimonas marina]|uniref:MarR family transcriptional regulator n=1 Tax=Sulfurimonas marina TaxID=2590551 RepID=A0A7M1AVF1_9BACT|nr:MarR family transcriptional regulator [Sulfurimonas marina]QOP41400.1 MarR family transcriptional regulator [Sulfurimonas marina]